jgi:methyl-accepting chemotaxis protein
MGNADDTFAPALLGTFHTAVSTLQTGVRNIHEAWDKLTLAVEQFLEAIRKKLEDDHWWNKVVEWFTDEIADALKAFQAAIEEARTKVGEILGSLEKTLNGALPVMSLFQVGLDWSTKVNANLTPIKPDVTQSGGIDTWHGPAHDTYRTREADQEEAVGQAIDQVKSISKWLSDVANANVHFVTDLLSQIGGIVEKIVEVTADVGEAAAAADPLSAQEAANDLSALLGRFASNIVDYLAGLGNRLADVLSLIGDVAGEHSDNSAFPGGHWPEAVNS